MRCDHHLPHGLLAILLCAAACSAPMCSAEQAREIEDGVSLPFSPWIGGKEYRVVDHGANPGSPEDAAPAIQAAIDAAAKDGGGQVIVGPGIHLCGPIILRSRIRLHLEDGAQLKVLPPSRYPGGMHAKDDFISAHESQDVVIDGQGTIDGQGAEWWSHWKDDGVVRPRLVAIRKSSRILVRGIRLTNAPMFNIAMSGVQDVHVDKVTVLAPPSEGEGIISHNTDACDVSGRYILVEDCEMNVGDDNFTCAGGTADVMIRNNRYGSGHGVSIGSPTKGGISRYVVKNCTFSGTTCGIRIKSDRDRGGLISDITYKDLRMEGVRYPILVYGAYNAAGEFRRHADLTAEVASRYPAAPVTSTTPRFRNIVFERIQATASSKGRCGLVWGLPEMPVDGLTMRDVTITGPRGFAVFQAQRVSLERCSFHVPDGIAPLERFAAEFVDTPAAP